MTDLRTGSGIAAAAFLMGDPARASMLAALLGGQALTAGELAAEAGITAQTASGHLAKLTEGGLLGPERQGRHRYFRLASPAVAEALEGLMALTAPQPITGKQSRTCGPKDAAMRFARTCYDHMAGRLAVALSDALQRDGHVRLEDGTGIVTDEGARFFRDFGLDLAAPATGRRPLCRTCLDWSERRPHLGGRLGAALLDRTVELGWLVCTPKSRTLMLTPAGERGFAATFRCEPVWQPAEPVGAGQTSGWTDRGDGRRSSADAARAATSSSA